MKIVDFQSLVIPVLIAFAITGLVGKRVIKFLAKLKYGQYVRDDGPQSHLKKSGTPTMGGVMFLSVVVVGVIYYPQNKEILPVLISMIGFGIIGFLDDYLKVVKKRSLGLRAWQKLLGQILITALFGWSFMNTGIGTNILIPFSGGNYIDLGPFFIPFFFIVVLGTVNGANFTDGIDGLASSVTLLIATFFTVVAVGIGSGIAPITAGVMGTLLAFLLYNVYPAKVFMGDTGSLALGGFVAAAAFMLQMPLFIVIVCAIYLAEVLSVIIQVGYFKISGGKRIFRMAPLHHHFEEGGWPETKVVAIFSIVTALLCLIGLYAF